MRDFKIGSKLAIVGFAAVAGLTLVLAISLFRLTGTVRADIADRTQKTVETAHSVMVHYHGLEQSGTLTREQAQTAALEAIRGMRYGNDDYFWVNDMQPKMVLHPLKPELDGKDIGGLVDADGVAIFRDMVDVVRADGAGFVNYRWEKPGKDEPQPKISYVKGFAPWGWIVGSGVYVDDLNAALWRAGFTDALIVLGVILFVAMLIWLIGRSISQPVVALTHRMRALAKDDTESPIVGLDRRDEVGEMAAALEVFREGTLARKSAEAAKAKADAEQNMVVATLTSHLESIAEGDLTASITDDFPESYAALKRNFNATLDSLRGLIGTISLSAESIRTGSDEIASASNDLARRTESNAASLEETSAALGQMEERLRATAQAAAKTSGQTQEAQRIVVNGRETADQVTDAMNRVADNAQGIDGVIEGLDKIAFQTRVLAMNAAVEAGRAGEAGRGFAVVADLVSALALRSEEEAKLARVQLTATQEDIGIAVGAVRRVDEAFSAISESFDGVRALVETMANDSKAQSEAIGEVTTAVAQVDTSTQQNAAMVEETSAAARTLATEVDRMTEQTGHFKTGGGMTKTTAPWQSADDSAATLH
ncbi:cache domain-containing protein [Stakelama tenebrarum]|uniref:HAMP domain-containing protein n=1 Tax=Stakelama tenebrarum TaxID=2711215 RepID=A0A6G6Y869_9SPHN|nr:cache domain-containing protein [Sphingosinithalassobacter tenebrarum]QIG81041.1 HAMP domain-containing protein [Sphingosinithalassobacter tenebrarum]